MWYILKGMDRSPENEISADIHVPPDSPWFEGHFPGAPILPGVAQIGMAVDAIGKARNRELMISSVRRVRFKRMIRPGDQLKVIAAPLNQEIGAYSFRIMIQEEAVCSGVITVEKKGLSNEIPEMEERNSDV
jgi:3-hydroxymyristoyl/3-hydroxydecanoyl-(acyl carrier protein) dehydratase